MESGFPANECQFQYPGGDDDFMRPWSHSPGVTSMNFDFQLDPAELPNITRAELLEKLRGSGLAETDAGRSVVSRNALKHGERSADAIAQRRELRSLLARFAEQSETIMEGG